ncbi:MAG: DNA-directed RNA polymerase subunit beta', partial [Lachnospiraceae bacterium]|nr:DNA-directed RNA polymerase subunit beta' [Lachnospiraceae bacterium]
KVQDGQEIEAGDELTEGSVNPHDILRIKGVDAVQNYMIQEVQRVYRLQGVEINDKHIEVIVRQMLKKIRIEDNGSTDMLPGTMVDILDFEDENKLAVEQGLEPAEGKRVMLGITKASLATNSFLSAASFQETTKVLTEAAIKGKIDPLIGLKENVLLGKLIPAGTGLEKYRFIDLDPDQALRDEEEVVLEAIARKDEKKNEEVEKEAAKPLSEAAITMSAALDAVWAEAFTAEEEEPALTDAAEGETGEFGETDEADFE